VTHSIKLILERTIFALAIWLSQESIIVIDYCVIDRLLRDQPIIKLVCCELALESSALMIVLFVLDKIL